MAAIIKNFTIKLTERQAGQIRRQFQRACQEAGVDGAAMIAQPKIQWGGCGSLGLKPAVLDCAVISLELKNALGSVIKSHRDAQALEKMRQAARLKEGA